MNANISPEGKTLVFHMLGDKANAAGQEQLRGAKGSSDSTG